MTSTTSAVGMRGRQGLERATRGDDALVVDEQAAVLLGPQQTAVEGVVGGVEKRAAEQPHVAVPGRRDAVALSSAKDWSSAAATETAIVAGSLPASAGRPIGVTI